MSSVMKIFLSMSFSGFLLILMFFAGKRFLKDIISRQWQYYIWLIVILRLLFPFGPDINLMGKIYQAIDQMMNQVTSVPQQHNSSDISTIPDNSANGLEEYNQEIVSQTEKLTTDQSFWSIFSFLASNIWVIWLIIALILLIRKVTIYQSFKRYINAGLTPVSNTITLDKISIIGAEIGIKKPVELCINPLVSSPLLMGFFHPCIVLPCADISEKVFRYIVLHELTHYKRRDMFYKWLVQITLCLHWFNPLVYLMSSEITKACEFSCDEAVLITIGYNNAGDYGKTLLDAMAAVGRYKESLTAVTLSENKQLLKERLSAIMCFRKKSKAVTVLTGVLTLFIIIGAIFIGVYPVAVTVGTASNLISDIPLPEYVEVDFSGISIIGQGPGGVSLVRTSDTKITFEYLNMDCPENWTTSADIVEGIMQITVRNSEPDGLNVDFGSEPQNIVCVYIPDAIYTSFDIQSKEMVLQMQDFNAPINVTSKRAGFWLIDTDIIRGTYNIDVTSGPIYIEAGVIQKDIIANASDGSLTVRFNDPPANLYLDSTNCGPVVERPSDWPAICRIGNESPKLIFSNTGPATFEVVDK